ncbi:unnamed protein product [Nezara viridula]|uniref:Uncharacterized protein n=1 Tax=Nezara viridula TaxID=85310 RepID=A0A9P0H714_NEZVI|nr:unnamed protein product [Nezara viridula]CAH1396608.1 unnamed protein product [Nezara viridula]
MRNDQEKKCCCMKQLLIFCHPGFMVYSFLQGNNIERYIALLFIRKYFGKLER